MTNELKQWTIEDFLAECRELRDNQYTYNYENMPTGICNNHKVAAYKLQWSSVTIDGRVENLWPDWFCNYGEATSAIDYIKEILESEPSKHYAITYKSKLPYFTNSLMSYEFDGTEARLEADLERHKEVMGAYDVNVKYLGYSWEF